MPSSDSAPAGSLREARRRQRTEQTRTAVLDAAEDVFAASGYHASSIRSVADRCEVAIGSIYALFQDKDDLFAQVVRRRGDTLREVVVAAAGRPGRADDVLTTLAEVQIGFHRAHPAWAHLAIGVLSAGSTGALPRLGAAALYEVGARIAEEAQAPVIRRGQQEGVIRAGSPLALANTFAWMLAGFHLQDDQRVSGAAALGLGEFLGLVRDAFSVHPPA
jgi:AcrR family transcriptional regulator